MPFVNEGGKRSHLGIYVSNALQEFIFDSSKFDLLERERIDSLLQEHEFNSSGLVSSLTTKKLGNLLGADIVLIGTISLDHKTFKINSRIVDLESGSVLSISHVKVVSTPTYINKFNTYIDSNKKSITGAYELTIGDVIVKDRKKDGRNWDIDPIYPDIFYSIYINGKLVFPNDFYNVPFIPNQFHANFDNIKAKIVLEEDDVLTIYIKDRDHLDDDIIGSIVIPPSKIQKMLNKKETFSNFDQVIKLDVTIKRID